MKKIANIHITLCMCIVALFVLMPITGYGMSFKLSKSLYKLYTEAYGKATSQEGLVLADSLRRMSIASGSHIGEVLALCVPVRNRFHKSGDLAALEEAIKPLQEKALQYGYMEYYYYAISNKVYYLIREKKYQTAIDYMKREQQFAKTQSHPYGVFVGYEMLGIIHLQRGEFRQAVKIFEEALNCCKSNKLDHSLESTYRQICSCYRQLLDFESMESFTEKELKDCKDEDNRAVLETNLGLALFMLGKDTEFIDNYNKFKKIDAEKYVSYKQIANAQDVFKLLIEGKSEEAWTIIEEMEPSDDKTIIEMAYYKKVNNFLNAMECMQKLMLSQYKLNRVNIVSDMADLNAILNKKAIEQIDKLLSEIEKDFILVARCNHAWHLMWEHSIFKITNTDDYFAKGVSLTYINKRLVDSYHIKPNQSTFDFDYDGDSDYIINSDVLLYRYIPYVVKSSVKDFYEQTKRKVEKCLKK